MSNGTAPILPQPHGLKDWRLRYFAGRGIVETVIALSLVGTLCYLLIFKEKDGLLGSFMNILFVVIAFYFRNDRNRPNGQD